jgi:hypothetical protein
VVLVLEVVELYSSPPLAAQAFSLEIKSKNKTLVQIWNIIILSLI